MRINDCMKTPFPLRYFCLQCLFRNWKPFSREEANLLLVRKKLFSLLALNAFPSFCSWSCLVMCLLPYSSQSWSFPIVLVVSSFFLDWYRHSFTVADGYLGSSSCHLNCCGCYQQNLEWPQPLLRLPAWFIWFQVMQLCWCWLRQGFLYLLMNIK